MSYDNCQCHNPPKCTTNRVWSFLGILLYGVLFLMIMTAIGAMV
jgi:hypothetical protein